MFVCCMGTKLLFGKTAGAKSRRSATKKARDFTHPFFHKSTLLTWYIVPEKCLSDVVTLVTL